MELAAALEALSAAMAGRGPAIELAADGTPNPVVSGGLAPGTAAVVRTSGSTGTPKATMLGAEALAASALATAQRLGGEGQWLLALGPNYVAGLQVLARSIHAGTRPEVMDLSAGFTPEAFMEAAGGLTGRFRITSLVPTQLHRLLESPSEEAVKALRRFDAILLGGARLPDSLRAEAARHSLKIVRTYGMSETCGGCVYDGVPLEGVRLAFDQGRILIGGDVVAAGYLDNPELTAAHFHHAEGTRWFRTSDLGALHDGVLLVSGRADDVLITGGVKVSAAAVAAAIEAVPGVRAALVAGIDNPEWGTQVGAAVVGTATEDEIRAHVRRELGGPAAPRHIVPLDALPLLENGKPDRLAVAELLRSTAKVPPAGRRPPPGAGE
ncbi:AMP-binding protein [Arthrobacter mangrovi]|uniref:O-succinylbenzoic acid--CoA ligase n=1 Tax=Arthrobacter mangrovi TaxID=2966350 RepID=A0ABQ5MVG6_9MICC|nr:AMP-binding protein [Arthrobacter mangrovi]GLB67637.1 O-succinylbenzoic acid--CoA ligase [Arthrobacter mangrovi]